MSYLDVNIKYMFDNQEIGPTPGSLTADTATPVSASAPTPTPAPAPTLTPTPGAGAVAGAASPAAPGVPAPPPVAGVPLERLEAQICELAGHLAAATCRFLVLLGDFDARRGWASWEMPSCAVWLSWKCQMSSGTAREHVRVARALQDLPAISAEFAAGRLSYAKVRALTRIATPATEQGLVQVAAPMTANQLERFARAHRQHSAAEDAAAKIQRRLTWRQEDDGSLSGTFHLPPLQGAVLIKALRAAIGDLEHPHGPEHPHDPAGGPGHPHEAGPPDVSAGTPPASEPPDVSAGTPPVIATSSGLADALVVIAEEFLAGKVAAADNPDVYQVIVHVGTDAITPADPAADPADPAGVSAETPAAALPVPGDPADPARRHVEDGPAVSASTTRMLTCTAALSWMLHGRDGTVLDAGRRRRRPSAALRRAARERDTCRCRFPGCESRRVDLHHIQYWSNGGRTTLANLISLCRRHHTLVHDRGYLIAAGPAGTFTFSRSDGTPVPASPALPPPAGTIEDSHDADITPGTIIPPWYGERLNLDHALYTCLASERNQAHPPHQEEQPEPFRPRKWVIELSDAIEELSRRASEVAAAGLR
jgi:5-methylcytosine-specific restriction endonuclease McrA